MRPPAVGTHGAVHKRAPFDRSNPGSTPVLGKHICFFPIRTNCALLRFFPREIAPAVIISPNGRAIRPHDALQTFPKTENKTEEEKALGGLPCCTVARQASPLPGLISPRLPRPIIVAVSHVTGRPGYGIRRRGRLPGSPQDLRMESQRGKRLHGSSSGTTMPAHSGHYG